MPSNRPGRSEPSIQVNPAHAPDVADLNEAIAVVDAVELGARIKAARRAKSMTQGDVAAGTISAAYLSRIESGSRRPDLKVLRVIAERVGTTTHELLLGLTPRQWSARRAELDWAQLSLRTGDAAKALEQTTALLQELPDDSRLYRRALVIHAGALEATGDYEQAAARLEQLVDGEMDGAPALEALTALSRVYRQAGELGRAIKVGDRAEQRIADLGLDGSPEAVKLTLTVAAAHCEGGDVGYAARLCQKALQNAEALQNPSERAGCYWNASIIESRRGNHTEAVALGQKALHVLDEADSTRNTARLRTQLGILHLRLDPPQVTEALGHLARAEQELLTSDASPADLASNRLAQAKARFLIGDLRAAQAEATECLESTANGAPLVAAEARVLLGQIAFQRGDNDGAQARYREAILLLSGIGADRSAAQLWFELGGLWMSVGCPEEALDAFQRAGASTGLRAKPVAAPVTA
ncbi:helix-turn-helix domain-containing protein [Nocardioides pakistanensis]